MTDDAGFESALVCSAFALAAAEGWRRVSTAAAARHAGLDLARARRTFPCRASLLAAFGRQADAHALGAIPANAAEDPVKDRLFDLLMRRIDFLQQHRAGVLALMRALPAEPHVAALLGRATLFSMGWMLEGAGVSARGVRGELRKRGLLLVWAYALRAWARDESEDLGATMAALDQALSRADGLAARLTHARKAAPPAETEPDPEPGQSPPGHSPAGHSPAGQPIQETNDGHG